MLPVETIDRLQTIDAELAQLDRLRDQLSDERDALADTVMTIMESAEITKHQTPRHVVQITPGTRRVNWYREFERVAKGDAVKRVKKSAPRVPELVITKRTR